MPKKIRVHEKALAHLSRGLYRSPASALRELVSNAWDANATTIHIDTNYPNFLQLTVQDDGLGFTKHAFDGLMSGGIGNSEKRNNKTPLIHGRAVIGRLGIGMLGIAQVTGGFTITSKTSRGEAFRAKVRLYDLIKSKLDTDDVDIVVEEGVHIGTYEFVDVDPARLDRGTTIVADDIHPGFSRSFQDSLPKEKIKLPALQWKDCLKIVGKAHSLQELGDYWRFLWSLSASCPIPYVDANALPEHLVKAEQARLLAYQFRVVVDGRQLFKPVHLKDNPGGYTAHRIERQSFRVYGRNVILHGYIAVQEGTQLKPDELRGVLVRIKDVAIGYYDPAMLDYRTNEGPRSRWLTGELFVEEGLEDALNIDRDSFNRVHPDFRAVQNYLHGILKIVFSEVWKKIDSN